MLYDMKIRPPEDCSKISNDTCYASAICLNKAGRKRELLDTVITRKLAYYQQWCIGGYTLYTNLRVFLTAYTRLSDHK